MPAPQGGGQADTNATENGSETRRTGLRDGQTEATDGWVWRACKSITNMPPHSNEKIGHRALLAQGIGQQDCTSVDVILIPLTLNVDGYRRGGGEFVSGQCRSGTFRRGCWTAVGNFAGHLECNAVHGLVDRSGRGGGGCTAW